MSQGCEIALEIDEPVAFARRFSLRVRRSWPATHLADDFDEARLKPIHVRLSARRSSRDGARVFETLDFDAWLPKSGEITIEALTLRAAPRAGGEVLVAHSKKRTLTVPPLAPEGGVETPVEVRDAEPRAPWGTMLAGLAGAAGLALAWTFWRRRRIAIARAQEQDPERIAERQVAEVERSLRALTSEDPATRRVVHEGARALAEVTRAWLGRHVAPAATTWTRASLLADPRLLEELPPTAMASVEEILTSCDREKYERTALSPDELEHTAAEVRKLLASRAPIRTRDA